MLTDVLGRTVVLGRLVKELVALLLTGDEERDEMILVEIELLGFKTLVGTDELDKLDVRVILGSIQLSVIFFPSTLD